MDIYWHGDLEAHITSHGADACTIANILQSAEVWLVGLVEEVLARHRELYAVVSEAMQVGAYGEVHQAIVRRCRLRIVESIVVVLPEGIAEACCHVCALQAAQQGGTVRQG